MEPAVTHWRSACLFGEQRGLLLYLCFIDELRPKSRRLLASAGMQSRVSLNDRNQTIQIVRNVLVPSSVSGECRWITWSDQRRMRINPRFSQWVLEMLRVHACSLRVCERAASTHGGRLLDDDGVEVGEQALLEVSAFQ